MFRKSTLALAALSFVASSLFANTLEFKSGFIQANTSIMGDSNINPKSTAITTALSMDGTPQTLKGDISLDLLSLKSENSSRDEHMYEALKAKENKLVSLSIKEVTKAENGYTIFGTLHLNHVDKAVVTVANITESGDTMSLKGGFSIKMSDFNIEPPTLLFLSVRDQIDINYDLELSQK